MDQKLIERFKELYLKHIDFVERDDLLDQKFHGYFLKIFNPIQKSEDNVYENIKGYELGIADRGTNILLMITECVFAKVWKRTGTSLEEATYEESEVAELRILIEKIEHLREEKKKEDQQKMIDHVINNDDFIVENPLALIVKEVSKEMKEKVYSITADETIEAAVANTDDEDIED